MTNIRNWENKIVRYGSEAPDQLLANERNHRVHGQDQQRYMLAALDDVGWVQDVIVNLRTSDEWEPGKRNVPTLLDGHLRVKLALRHDVPSIPVKYVDLTPREEAVTLASFDQITGMAKIDPAMLNMLLKDVHTDEPALQELMAKMADEAGVVPPGGKDGDPGPECETCPTCGQAVRAKS